MISLHNPDTTLWYIVFAADESVSAYGRLNPTEQLASVAGVVLSTFTDRDVFLARLADLGIIPTDGFSGDLPSDLEQARIVLKSRVNALRIEKLILPVTYMGHPFQTDAQTMLDCAGLIALVNAGIPLPTDFTWRAYDNVNVSMVFPQLVGFGGTIAVYRNACFNRSWALKAEIDASDTPALVDLTAGWPDNTNP